MILSVIVPIYNTEAYLNKCLDSLLVCTSKDYELILVNDGSPDNSNDIVQSYLKTFSNIKYVKKENGGLSSARNAGMVHAQGRYITFVDSDDYVSDDFVSQLLDAIKDEKVDLLVSGVNKIEVAQEKIVPYKFPTETIDLNTLKAHKILETYDVLGSSFMHGKVFLLELIKTKNLLFINVTPQEDTIFFLDYLQHANSLKLLNYSGYHYVIHQRASLTKKLQRYDVLFTISEALLELYNTLFSRLEGLSIAYKNRMVSEYGIDQRIFAWLDIYSNNKLKKNSRLPMLLKERNKLKKIAKTYDYKARRGNQQKFYSLLVSKMPLFLVDSLASIFFFLKSKFN
ncbi:glycosyltransferase [Flavobacterium sp. ASW18X]|uniref:glycosyltransferase n=1 Tax=Flavobacterium sp. ASW18X TaxID=2572595 RepID=UPI0010AEC81C|nr:glycosyltransferase [Flavobacterium sp. ASW18X]TKD65548.1 glycosyltransferase [Flavobacterium sp. ASW18X]